MESLATSHLRQKEDLEAAEPGTRFAIEKSLEADASKPKTTAWAKRWGGFWGGLGGLKLRVRVYGICALMLRVSGLGVGLGP